MANAKSSDEALVNLIFLEESVTTCFISWLSPYVILISTTMFQQNI